ncbi:penicillin-binding transpeptidase domain-containing protein [Oceanobacillus piezotolerans]|uniref:penicillin-binding transpeptidase domain-containing protein n=1 Tax=Oceanobacillus piezotolerans TaxID=2448030 RepID=UPI001FEBB3CF|nr:penicillin-binding transpeptidase domain-containing protein [Oceanobacillus piezotolerans]
MKKYILLGIILLFLAACSEDNASPNDRFQTFITHWNEQAYNEMYTLFSSETKTSYSEEESIERQAGIYESMGVSNVEVSFDALDEESINTAFEEGKAEIPFHVEMDTLAGPVTFDYSATLVQEGEEEEKNWFVQWDSGFIYPELKNGGEIRLETIEPKRGEILDRNNIPLALNDEVYEVGLVPEKLAGNSNEQVANLLGISVDSIDKALQANWVQPNSFVPLKQISPSNETVVNQLLEVPGVLINSDVGRVYPAGEAAAHLVGYLRTVRADDFEEFDESQYAPDDMIGARGLERLYEAELKGQEGVQIYISKEDEENVILAEKPVQNGENITLTIDINAQQRVYVAYDGDAGTTAAIDPKTGETLALVSSPAFDPNEIMYGTSEDIWERLEGNEKQPLINRSISTFAPGSVLKPITAAIGLKNGSINPEEGFEIEGLTWSKGEEWGGYEVTRVSTSNGPVDLRDALVRSDNIYFAMQAVKMGADKFVKGMEEFGFGEEIPYSYPTTASMISNSGSLDDEVLLVNSSYGQGEVQMSAIHLASAYTTFLNDGKMIKPTIFADEEDGQVWKEDLITEEQSDIIQEALRAVVTDGAVKEAQKADFPISGKTGTVELKLTLEEEDGAINSWFVGYPTDDQDILIAMMIEQTQDKESGYVMQKVTNLLTEFKKQ